MTLSTVQSTCTEEQTVRKSRFIASVNALAGENEVKEILNALKAHHRNATHHPYAYRIGFEHILERYSDDGEPPKSSGFPILQELRNAHLTNILLVVTRYFGGIKLGIGGLSRAYRESARSIILHAQRIPAIPLKRFRLSLRQEDAGKARNLLERHKARILEEAYGRNADYTVEIAEERYRNLSDAIQDLTQGEATITQIEPHREK